MLILGKKDKQIQGSAFTTTQAVDIDYAVLNMDKTLVGFTGLFKKKEKKKFEEKQEEYAKQQADELKKLNKGTNEPKTEKKWRKVVDFLFGGLKTFFKGIGAIVKSLSLSKATGILGMLLGLFLILKLGLLDTLIPAALAMLKTLVLGIIKYLPKIAKFIYDIATEYIPKFVIAIADALSDALGLSKNNPFRKMMPFILGAVGAFWALSKVLGVFGIKTIPLLLKGFSALGKTIGTKLSGWSTKLTPLLTNPFVLAGVAAIAAGIGIYEFVKHSEEVSAWAKKNKQEMQDLDKKDIELLSKLKAGKIDISKLNGKQLTELRDAAERQDSIWRSVKKGFFGAVGSIADYATDRKKVIQKNENELFKLQMKQNKSTMEQQKLDALLMIKHDVLSKSYWKAQWSTLTTVVSQIGGFFKNLKKKISNIGSWFANTFFSLIDKVKNGFGVVVGPIVKLFNSVKDIGKSIGGGFGTAITSISSFFEPMVATARKAFATIGDAIGAMLDSISYYAAKIHIPGFEKKGAESRQEYRLISYAQENAEDSSKKADSLKYARTISKKGATQKEVTEAGKGLTEQQKDLTMSYLQSGMKNFDDYMKKLSTDKTLRESSTKIFYTPNNNTFNGLR
jgi:hypothetical protein